MRIGLRLGWYIYMRETWQAFNTHVVRLKWWPTEEIRNSVSSLHQNGHSQRRAWKAETLLFH